jgi:putative peptidoglycan lipid II flippase
MFNHFFNGNLINAQSRGIALPAMILAVSAVASRLLGVLRDWLLAARFGAGPDLDVYFAAFRIPDFIYNILVFGGIAVAFLPLFSDYYEKDRKSAWRFASNTLNVFFAFLVLLSAILFVFTPFLMNYVAPGFSPEQSAQTVFLSRLMFLSPIIFGIASIFSGVLQYFKKFLAYSLAALFYNLGIIAGIVWLAPTMGIMGVGIGVIAGALAYLIIQIAPAMKSGFLWRPVFSLGDPSLRRVFRLMLPRTAGIAANQINLIVPTVIGSALAAGSIAVFNLSNNIYSLPVGIIGVSFATAAFAEFSKYAAAGQFDELARKFSAACRQIGYLSIPAAFLIFVSRDPIVNFLYYHGQFTREAASLVSASLGIFCLGIYFAAMMPVMFRLFFALRDTASPTITTLIAVAANIAMNYWFVAALQEGSFAQAARDIFNLNGVDDVAVLGLPLAYTVANILQFGMLWILIYRKKSGLVRTKEIASSLFKSLAAGIFMAIAVYLVIGIVPVSGHAADFLSLAAAAATAAAVYFPATFLLRSPEIAAAGYLLKSKWSKKH